MNINYNVERVYSSFEFSVFSLEDTLLLTPKKSSMLTKTFTLSLLFGNDVTRCALTLEMSV